MGQFLRIVIILFGIWLVLRLIKRALSGHKPGAAPPPADMLRCDYCGVFVPRSEAVQARGRSFCSDDHAAADRGRDGELK
jgi:uncharacterized protein